MDDFAKALNNMIPVSKGQVVRGKVFQYESDGAYVDIGGRSAAAYGLRLQPVTDLSVVLPLQGTGTPDYPRSGCRVR